MTASDYLLISLDSIRRNRLRSVLTIIGVSVAIGALFSMLAFGIGLQTNVMNSFNTNQLMKLVVLHEKDRNDKKYIPLNDSTLTEVRNLDHVRTAFAEESKPVRIQLHDQDRPGMITGLPFSYPQFFDTTQYLAGHFFTSDSAPEVILNKKVVEGLLLKSDTTLSGKEADSVAKTMIGKPVDLVAITYDSQSFTSIFSIMSMLGSGKPPVRDSVMTFNLAGIVDLQTQFGMWNQLGYLTSHNLDQIPSLGFENVMSLLSDQGQDKSATVNVYVDNASRLAEVQKILKDKGYNATSILDQFKEIRRVFAVVNSLLGALGIMALFIATLGLVNTLIMSIYERTREIGILKSLGAKEREIKMLFVTEAGMIGFMGALFGIPLGWVITRVANVIFMQQFFKEIDEKIVLFTYPYYLIIGAALFSILFSMFAGFYPANRAARIDPVKALRHD